MSVCASGELWGRLYTYGYTFTTRMTSALRWAVVRAILMRDKVTRRCPQTTTFEVTGEPKQIRTEVPQFNTLPLGQTELSSVMLCQCKGYYFMG